MKPLPKLRIDHLLVERGLVASRQKAQALILAGQVLVNRQKALKPGQTAPVDAQVEVLEQTRFVSRGGFKLEHALQHWQLAVAGKTCVDVGASTGGFTDCLLQHGAARVYAVDVGSTQLDWKLQTDSRVVVRDHLNARKLQPSDLGEPCELLVCDVSFISVTMILPAFPSLLTAEAGMVILVKPQFEVGRAEVGKGGIVRDPALHNAACEKVRAAVELLGYRTDIIPSPILGAEGNREFLLHASASN
jgi:23S rRNA (cytidine1920-2'-O)/16S rRNA (cytidine1409-2'-O)-methyltransferase